MSDLNTWLESLGLEKYIEIFARQDIGLAEAPELTDQDLEKLGLSLGHRRRFLAAAAKLRGAPAVEPAPKVREQLERRQLTVVFVDLVGSTQLASQLDPEEMARLLKTYRDACAAIIARYDGHIAQYLGDGVMAYFGYPRAQEHAAERAVKAALELVNAVAKLQRPDGGALQARAGIATGVVATRDAAAARDEQTAVGPTPNLAARLQALAQPGWVLVSPLTYELTRSYFEYLSIGSQAIKGYDEPIQPWRVLSETAVESRFVATRDTGGSRLIGRERELAFLGDAWQRACGGNGHVVLVSGEAGMGKSTLAESFAERMSGQPLRLLRCQCSPYHENIALHPVVQLLRRRLDIRADLPVVENLRRVDQMLARIERPGRVPRLLLAELLELPADDRLSPMELTQSQRKSETLAILEEFLLANFDDATVLLLVEDAHWSDPTTRSLVERLLNRIEKARALVVITHRPEMQATWAKHANATALACKPLGREQCAELVRGVAGASGIDDRVIGEIIARSDGVPLFARELTRTVVDLRAAERTDVPLTLRDSLAARLDALGGPKEVAQAAAVIGRHFSHTLLASVAGVSDASLRASLQSLEGAGLVLATLDEDEPAYAFNHALVQDAAYESLARTRRQELHARVAQRLAADSAASAALIAHHFSRAGDARQAYHYWMLAADDARKRTALAEALANLVAALEEARRVSDEAVRMQLLLDVQLKVGAVHMIQSGPASSQVATALGEAYALAKRAGTGAKQFQATWGLYLNAASKFDFQNARTKGEELLAISEKLGDADLQFEALHHRWGISYFSGQTANILRYTQQGIEGYDAARHHRFSEVYAGHDPGVCAHCCNGAGLALRGRSAAARATLERGIQLAERLEHPVTLGFAFAISSFVAHLAGDNVACAEFSERTLRVAERYAFAQHGAFASFLQGLLRTLEGKYGVGLERMAATFDTVNGYAFYGGYPSVALADAQLRAGRGADALAVTTRTLDGLQTPESGLFAAELWRLKGDATWAAVRDEKGAEHCLRTASRIAAGQESKVFGLRAALSLARLLAERGRHGEAREVLSQGCTEALPEWIGREMPEAQDLAARLGR